MRELLEKWAALEPERCRVDDERASVMADAGTPLERPRFSAQYHRLGGYEADILASVIEAIEARGWYWDARSQGGSSHRFYTCTVEDSVAHGEFGEPVTKPLLAAYLAALARVKGGA